MLAFRRDRIHQSNFPKQDAAFSSTNCISCVIKMFVNVRVPREIQNGNDFEDNIFVK